MKKKLLLKFTLTILTICLWIADAEAQCAMCTKTAQQLGEKPAAALNSAIIYLMLAPFAVMGVIAYRWWKNRETE